ncbi:MAG: hypothetical protein LBQ59_05380 [Candidatus Peribacteria bacterium]|nr:hypothetical protein [Candidatus Peribacteria bacterium]
MISPLFCRQNFNPEYFRKEHNFIIENHKKEEFIDFFYSNSHNFGSEKQNQNAVIEILYSSLFHAIRS